MDHGLILVLVETHGNAAEQISVKDCFKRLSLLKLSSVYKTVRLWFELGTRTMNKTISVSNSDTMISSVYTVLLKVKRSKTGGCLSMTLVCQHGNCKDWLFHVFKTKVILHLKYPRTFTKKYNMKGDLLLKWFCGFKWIHWVQDASLRNSTVGLFLTLKCKLRMCTILSVFYSVEIYMY